ncbi:MAG: Rieske (2Fe-2S) protein [Chloroflexi bacterium]|nr:MAG: Rieske (2Fe-2S) protein [Chloroflexota bacterium]
MTRYVVGRVSELPPGSVRIVPANNPQGIGVFNVRGTYYALKNVCPHQGGPLCSGPITGTTVAVQEPGAAPSFAWVRDGEIVRCPWHRWEFDITTGRTVFTSRMRVATYRVEVETFRVTTEDGLVVLEA